jgi:hypothetical protein
VSRTIATNRLTWIAIAALALVGACGGTSASPPRPVSPQPPDAIQHDALTTATGHDVTVTVTDESGMLDEATSGTPGDGASVEPYRVVVTNDDPSTLRMVWVGGPCDADDSLTIDSTGRNLLLVEPECAGDAVAFDRVLVLHLSSPIDATEVHAVLQDGLDTPG